MWSRQFYRRLQLCRRPPQFSPGFPRQKRGDWQAWTVPQTRETVQCEQGIHSTRGQWVSGCKSTAFLRSRSTASFASCQKKTTVSQLMHRLRHSFSSVLKMIVLSRCIEKKHLNYPYVLPLMLLTNTEMIMAIFYCTKCWSEWNVISNVYLLKLVLKV